MPAICRLYQRTGISFISYYLLYVVVSNCVLSCLVLFLCWNLRKARVKELLYFSELLRTDMIIWLTPGSQGCYDEFVVKYVMHSGFEFCGRDWSAYNVADLMRNSHEFLSPQDGSPLKSDASFDGRFLDFLCEIRTNFWVHETWIRTAAFWNRMRPSMVARQFCGCLTTFSLFVRLSLS